MRQVREVLRLANMSPVTVNAASRRRVGISRYTVAEYLRRAMVVGITWPVPSELDDSALEARLFSSGVRCPGEPETATGLAPAACRATPCRCHPAAAVGEYREPGNRMGMATAVSATFTGTGGPAFRGRCARPMSPVVNGLFVDFAGQTVPITDPFTGAVRQAQIFVAALGASNCTAEAARWTQGLADWIGCHVNALGFFGGVTRQIVCDNLQAGVTAACRAYEPGINRTYQEMAAHYGAAIVPTRCASRVTRPKVEVAVQVVER